MLNGDVSMSRWTACLFLGVNVLFLVQEFNLFHIKTILNFTLSFFLIFNLVNARFVYRYPIIILLFGELSKTSFLPFSIQPSIKLVL